MCAPVKSGRSPALYKARQTIVLMELGMDWDRIEALKDSGALA